MIDGASVLRLGARVRLRHDPARGAFVLLAPERVLLLDSIAATILQSCDGKTSVDTMTNKLAETFAGERERIRADVMTLLQDLADKGLVVT